MSVQSLLGNEVGTEAHAELAEHGLLRSVSTVHCACQARWPPHTVRVLAISGSLRQASINSAFCRAAACLAPPPLSIVVFDGLRHLPPYNPDLECSPPRAVYEFRASVKEANSLIIASPEYAHGVPGVLKNALDWLLGEEGLVCKAVLLVNTAPQVHHAYEALREILDTMSTRIVTESSIALPSIDLCTTEEIMRSLETRATIERALRALAAYLKSSLLLTANLGHGAQ